PDGAEQSDVRRHRAHSGEPGQVRIERIDLALVGRAHRTPRGVERHRRCAALLPVLHVFAKARREDVLESGAGARLAHALVEIAEIAAFPELVLEKAGVALGATDLEALQEDLPPAPDREECE